VSSRGAESRARRARLARHLLSLEDGHQVGVAVVRPGHAGGAGPRVHREGILYAQTLARLVRMGFKVVAIDVAGPRRHPGDCPPAARDLASYVALLDGCSTLGIGGRGAGRPLARRAAGDPAGGRASPAGDGGRADRRLRGQTWDRLIGVSASPRRVLAGIGALLVADTLSTLPLLPTATRPSSSDVSWRPTLAGHALQPWRMLGPGVSLLRSSSSKPLCRPWRRGRCRSWSSTATGTWWSPGGPPATRPVTANAWLVTVHGGTHSWVLKDPETLPGVARTCCGDRSASCRDVVYGGAGLDAATASPEQVETCSSPRRPGARRSRRTGAPGVTVRHPPPPRAIVGRSSRRAPGAGTSPAGPR
jgi:hypothetical protein